LIKIDIVLPQNDIKAISEVQKINVGGIIILKVKGRGNAIAPKIHASKGTEMFTPEF
jgi:nitrogen regulatory protein P-II 1